MPAGAGLIVHPVGLRFASAVMACSISFLVSSSGFGFNRQAAVVAELPIGLAESAKRSTVDPPKEEGIDPVPDTVLCVGSLHPKVLDIVRHAQEPISCSSTGAKPSST
jgi:hypothetical protein